MKSIQVTSIVGAFAGMAFASPFEIQARAPITSAAFSNFTVSCTSTECRFVSSHSPTPISLYFLSPIPSFLISPSPPSSLSPPLLTNHPLASPQP